jgi:hypothetical protein
MFAQKFFRLFGFLYEVRIIAAVFNFIADNPTVIKIS